MDLTGKRLGKYELLERVGQGGMAHVYRANQPTIERDVAVKVLHSHLAEDATLLERFRREAKGLGSLRHPHIVNVIDFDFDDGWYYIVMDFIEGETLQAMLKRRAPLPVEEALRLAAKLAGALAVANRRGLVHRDVKPGNIMFADLAAQHPVITDFGLTRLLDNVSITISGSIAGTPAYMSPEAAQGEKVDARTDIYSLGVVLYEMVTGRQPYSGETPLSVIMKLVLEPLPSAASINPDLPAVVDAIIGKATAKAPSDRYQSAAESEPALREALAPCTGRGMAGSSALDLDRQTSRQATQQPVQTEPTIPPAAASQHPPRAAPKRRLPLLAIIFVLLLALAASLFIFKPGRENGAPAATAAPARTIIAAEALTTVAEEPPTTAATAPPTLQPAVIASAPPSAAAEPQPSGSFSISPPDGSGARTYALALPAVAPTPPGFHYELWFDLSRRIAPYNVGRLEVHNARIEDTAALDSALASRINGVRISLEPDFDDDPTIAELVYSGVGQAASDSSHIALFAVSD